MHTPDEKTNKLLRYGFALLAMGLVFLVLILFPIGKQEVAYTYDQITHNTASETELVPVDTNFGIVIPKIKANARILQDVDPYNSLDYQVKLTKGVAHAKGSALPGDGGNVFLFAHSSDNFYNANRYNSVFYLLHKLEAGDEIFVYRDNKRYVYVVAEKKTVSADDVSYLNPTASEEQLTLMTCWPPGTTLKRLIVIAKLRVD